MRVVLDTNVVVPGLNFPGNERPVPDLARRGRYALVLSPLILDEVRGVLVRMFGWKETVSDRAIAMLGDTATIIKPGQRPNVIANNEAGNQIRARNRIRCR